MLGGGEGEVLMAAGSRINCPTVRIEMRMISGIIEREKEEIYHEFVHTVENTSSVDWDGADGCGTATQ